MCGLSSRGVILSRRRRGAFRRCDVLELHRATTKVKGYNTSIHENMLYAGALSLSSSTVKTRRTYKHSIDQCLKYTAGRAAELKTRSYKSRLEVTFTDRPGLEFAIRRMRAIHKTRREVNEAASYLPRPPARRPPVLLPTPASAPVARADYTSPLRAHRTTVVLSGFPCLLVCLYEWGR